MRSYCLWEYVTLWTIDSSFSDGLGYPRNIDLPSFVGYATDYNLGLLTSRYFDNHLQTGNYYGNVSGPIGIS